MLTAALMSLREDDEVDIVNSEAFSAKPVPRTVRSIPIVVSVYTQIHYSYRFFHVGQRLNRWQSCYLCLQ
jgi:hypothetical protein